MIRKLYASGLIISEYGIVIKNHKHDDVVYILVDPETDTIVKVADNLEPIYGKLLDVKDKFAGRRIRVEKLPLSALRAMICYK